MKKTNLLILSFLIPISLFSQSYQIDSVVISHCLDYCDGPDVYTVRVDSFDTHELLINSNIFDTNGVLTSQTVNTYSLTNKMTRSVKSQFVNGSWLVYNENNYQYDLNDSLILEDYITYQYDASNVLISTFRYRFLTSFDTIVHTKTWIYQLFYNVPQTWNDQTRWTYYYDSLGQEFISLREDWNSTSGSFVLDNRYRKFYLPNGSIDYYTRVALNTAGLPTDSATVLYSYDSLGYLVQILENHWSYISLTWTPSQLDIYYYDSVYNNIAFSSHQNYDIPVVWDPCDDTTNTVYDNQNRVVSYLTTYCGAGGVSGWTAYGLTGIVDSSNHCSWTHSGNCSCQTCSYDYISLNSTGSTILGLENTINIFPNPAASEVEIRMNKNIVGQIFLEDMSGKILKQNTFSGNRYQLNISDIENGIYFVRMLTQNGNYLRKILVMHE